MLLLKKSFILLCTFFNISFIFAAHDVPILRDNLAMISVETLLRKYGNSIGYAKFKDAETFHYEKFPLSIFPENQPYKGTFAETFVLTIPNGRVSTYAGYIIIDEKYMLREFNEQCQWLMYAFNIINHWSDAGNFSNPRKVSGRVAVIARRGSENYAHYLVDLLGRLAILELMGIDYDYLYIPYEKPYDNKPYIKEILTVWGIDPLKIIQPCGEFNYIEADELIVPSSSWKLAPTPGETFHDLTILCGVYWPTWLLEFYRNKFLPMVSHKPNEHKFSKKVFISRKDGSPFLGRRMINEDEVFELFEAEGFERYVLSSMSFLEQVELFHNADIVVGANGCGLINIMFCKPHTKVIEIFQERADSTFYYTGQLVGADYTCVKTKEFPLHDRGGGASTIIPLDIIQEVIKNLNKSN
ncbi:MAG: glycosyltransferase family 61 protein [Candidatus Babeliales bacterium]|jgi:hypothetical protein